MHSKPPDRLGNWLPFIEDWLDRFALELGGLFRPLKQHDSNFILTC